MGISSQLAAARLIQPGVCTSSTRPASPYEGQVIYETDTNQTLTYSGLAWVMVNDLDTPPAQMLVTTQTVGTTVSSVTVSNCFTTDFASYLVTYTGGTASTSSNSIAFNFNGAPSAWYGNLIYANFANGGPLSAGYNNATGITHGGSISSGIPQLFLNVSGPFIAAPTFVQGLYVDGSNAGTVTATNANSTSYTGFVLTPGSGTISGGTIRVYGYRNLI